MIKRTFLILAFLAGLLSPAYSAGTISLSLTQQIDKDTLKPLNGGKLYFFRAGTTTPQVAYQDVALTIPLPGGSVYTLDAAGRIPQFFLADGQIKIRLANAKGVTQLAADNILVIGPSSGGGGGGGTVDPTTVIATGDIKARYGTGVLSGFVRANGRTIGSATSGASERANSDCQALFEYLWQTDANLAVSTGRGASANADWVANKTIILPDFRGRVVAGMDDMGNTSAARLDTLSSTTLGGAGGEKSHALTAAELAPHTHSGTTGNDSPDHTHATPSYLAGSASSGPSTGAHQVGQPTAGNTTGASARHQHPFTTDGGAGLAGTPHNVVQPTIVMTYYQKL